MTSYRRFWFGVLALLAMITAACSGGDSLGSINAPTSATSNTSTATPAETPNVNGPQVPSTPGTGTSVEPVYTLVKPNLIQSGNNPNCFQGTMADLQWILNMTDAGNTGVRFKTMVHHSDAAGCEATVENGRDRLVVSGVGQYTAHSRGTTNFSYSAREFSCGRQQVDITIDFLNGKEILIVGIVINRGTNCAPPPPPPVTPPASTCSATVTPARVVVGEWATIRIVTTNTTRLMMGEDEVTPLVSGVGTVLLQAQQSWVGTRQYNFTASGSGASGTCSTSLVVEPVAPTQCTLTATAAWDPTRSAVRYRLSVTPPSPGQAMAGFVVDGNTQNPSPVDIDRDLFFGFVPDNRTHNWVLNASYNPGNGGQSCAAQASVVIPQSQSCEVLNPPRFDTPIWTSMDQASRNSIVASTVTVYNGATWKFVLLARNSRTGEQWTKDTSERTVACGDQKTLGVSFDWTDHPADKWWTVLYKNGSPVYTSPQITRSDN